MRHAYSYIRMSTLQQLKGDSKRRQLELSENYAKSNNLLLIENIDGILLNDIGISAYKGENSRKGALGLFLDALATNKIPKDSVLLVESLDRLSREKITEALGQFMLIIGYGIEIVTLNDNQRYTSDILNEHKGTIFISLGSMIRANEESETKSKRLSAVWSNKRKIATSKIVTRKCPAWIQYDETSKKFKLIPQNSEIVKLIFDLCIHSCGLHGIARYLNENKIPVFGSGKLWYKSYINKILNNSCTYGEYQPYTSRDGVKKKAGQPIQSYYPSVVDEETFLLAKGAIERRNKTDRGRKGITFSNIFSGLIYCGHCNFKMILRNRGDSPKGGKYICCSNKNLSGGCTMRDWKLRDLESSLFKHFSEINFHDLLKANEDTTPNLSKLIEISELKITKHTKELDRIKQIIKSTDLHENIRKTFIDDMNEISSLIEFEEGEIINFKNKLLSEDDTKNAITSDELKELINKIDSENEDYFFRSSINQLLSRQINTIKLIHENDDFTPWEYDDESQEVIDFKRIFKIEESLDDFINKKEFKNFCINYHKKIVISYKTGITKVVLVGSDNSFVKKPWNLMRTYN